MNSDMRKSGRWGSTYELNIGGGRSHAYELYEMKWVYAHRKKEKLEPQCRIH